MKLRSMAFAAGLAAASLGATLGVTSALAQAKEQFFPVLVYRTGAYAPNGVPFANGYVDYLKYVNAKGYNALAMQHGAEPNAKVVKDILATLHDKNQGTGPKDEVGQVLYMRGLISAMLGVEGVKAAQERYGKGKVMNTEQVRWGLENLNLDQKKIDALGFSGVMRPVSTSCADHMGASWARLHTWDGAKWSFSSDWYQADDQILKPLIRASADKYMTEKKLQRRTAADCQ
ncbi:MAG: hypothetical protein EB036_10685 [Betaproteobacteria bacterium]|nr:hypothetical protein [Betaproteobacteria bacterium]